MVCKIFSGSQPSGSIQSKPDLRVWLEVALNLRVAVVLAGMTVEVQGGGNTQQQSVLREPSRSYHPVIPLGAEPETLNPKLGAPRPCPGAQRGSCRADRHRSAAGLQLLASLGQNHMDVPQNGPKSFRPLYPMGYTKDASVRIIWETPACPFLSIYISKIYRSINSKERPQSDDPQLEWRGEMVDGLQGCFSIRRQFFGFFPLRDFGLWFEDAVSSYLVHFCHLRNAGLHSLVPRPKLAPV